jgi:hypothetical protein
MEPQQIEQQRALLGLLGHTYGQMKEIDSHIAAAGSNAKFAGRSETLKRQFEAVATTPFAAQPNNDSELELPPVQSPVFIQPQAVPVQVQPIQHAAPAVQDDFQLEFNFKQVEKNVLQDIYNVLYDIKKILLENKNTQPAPKKKISDCILCGSKATVSTLANNAFEIRCSNCNASTSQEHATAKNAVKEWNKDNQ